MITASYSVACASKMQQHVGPQVGGLQENYLGPIKECFVGKSVTYYIPLR